MYIRIKKERLKRVNFKKIIQYKKIIEEKMGKKKFTQEFKQDMMDSVIVRKNQ